MTMFQHFREHLSELTGGRMLAPGDQVELDDEAQADPHNARLIDLNILRPTRLDEAVPAAPAAKASKAPITDAAGDPNKQEATK